MPEKEQKLESINEIEIDALAEDELEDVAGGCLYNSCSSQACSDKPLFTPG